jgi:hypothetical protein
MYYSLLLSALLRMRTCMRVCKSDRPEMIISAVVFKSKHTAES